MALDSKQCEAFLAVAEAGSFEQAAAALHITPSAVSLRVRALETRLGQPLIVRGRPSRATRAGRQLLQHLQRSRAMEQDLLAGLSGGDAGDAFFAVTLAVNADSLATWLLPALSGALQRERIALELVVDDQEHTHALLQAGLAHACVSAQPHAMRGCTAERLGSMRYRLVASPAFAVQWFGPRGITRASARKAPTVVFNHKDPLQANALLNAFGLQASAYPSHYVPASEPFVTAIRLGLGYGMVPELQIGDAIERGELIDVLPDAATDVPLYWHGWAQQPAPAGAARAARHGCGQKRAVAACAGGSAWRPSLPACQVRAGLRRPAGFLAGGLGGALARGVGAGAGSGRA
ncbi:LysR family transcriptional regulator ArgP [Acidovorax sp. SUPP3334]|uniref:LysR family transcriptional regulator ArgP n=1 Tax=Acidovorax sp. SUPP3334 TaxID=2920881 RepID=UPI0023DE4242|nr:LysR family transcriptional regulator ArgP [Acidovorax sp. SUPP3334]GKT24485.1 LysR family transcriptional regulator ArgP [Acidovorax sp. SUPP3334]